jgi:hypothetical protein
MSLQRHLVGRKELESHLLGQSAVASLVGVVVEGLEVVVDLVERCHCLVPVGTGLADWDRIGTPFCVKT